MSNTARLGAATLALGLLIAVGACNAPADALTGGPPAAPAPGPSSSGGGETSAGRASQATPPQGIAGAGARPKLVFSVDQAFANGVVLLADGSNPGYVAALDRVIAILSAYQQKYDVYALVNPMPSVVVDPANPANREKGRLNFVLGRLASKGIPFVLDAYSSDTYQIGRYGPSIDFAQDLVHGIAMSMSDPANPSDPSPFVLDYYVQTYGAMFAGIRIFETGSMSLTMRRCKYEGDCSWLGGGAPPMPTDTPDFFDATRAAELADYADQHGMFVVFSDPIWTLPELSDTGAYAQDFLDEVFRPSVQAIAGWHAGKVLPMYANNDEHHLDHFSDWPSFVSMGQPFGLSDQSWNCYGTPYTDETCPAPDFANWATTALSQRGASVVELEPFWYLFQWHRAGGGHVVAIGDSVLADIDYATAGYPTSAGTYLAQQLGVALP